MDKVIVNVRKDQAVVEGDSVIAQLIRGKKGKVKIHSPYGDREVKIVNKFKADKPKSKAKTRTKKK